MGEGNQTGRYGAVALVTSLLLLLVLPGRGGVLLPAVAQAAPDFVVSGITLTPASPLANGTFSATVKVTNQGTSKGDGKRFSLWLDHATSLSCGAPSNASVNVGPLLAGESKSLTLGGLNSGTAGAKTLRTFVDSDCLTGESKEWNNQRAKSYTVVPPRPDFVVTSLTPKPSSPSSRTLFQAIVKIKNRGGSAANGGKLTVWANRHKPQGCNATGGRSVNVGTLAGGESAVLTVDGFAAGSPGAKTLHAFVDSTCTTGESNEANNQASHSYTTVDRSAMPLTLRGVNFSIPVGEGDIHTLRQDWRANVVRYQMTPSYSDPMNPEDLDEYAAWLQEREIPELDAIMESCARNGLKVIIDLHLPPGGTTANYETRIFYDPVYNARFIEVWKQLATHYRGHPALLGYDLVNEPHQNTPPQPGLDFLTTQAKAIQAIRGIDSSAIIFVTPVAGENPDGFPDMKTFADPSLIYEVHMYIPHVFTLQGANDSFPKSYSYPGYIEEEYRPEELAYYDKAKLKEILQPVRDFQLRNNVRIFVGEFSAIRWAPGAAQYLKDCIAIFEEYGWDWAYHDYAAWDGFNLLYASGTHELIIDPANDRLGVVRAGLFRNSQN